MTNKASKNPLDFNLDCITYTQMSEILNINRGMFSKWGAKGWLHLDGKKKKYVNIPKTIDLFRSLGKEKEADALVSYLELKLAHDARNPKPKPEPILKPSETIIEDDNSVDATPKEIIDKIVENYENNELNSIRLKYGLTKYEAEGYLKTAQAIMAMREEEQQRGILVDVREVSKQIENIIMVAKSRLLSIPTKLAPKMVKTKKETLAQKILTDAISEALEDLSKASQEYNAKAEEAIG